MAWTKNSTRHAPHTHTHTHTQPRQQTAKTHVTQPQHATNRTRLNPPALQGDELQQQVVDTPGAALTHRPLAVLVNGGSASASEILSGALHDNARAVVLGDEHTYGKGRIQSVFELQVGGRSRGEG